MSLKESFPPKLIIIGLEAAVATKEVRIVFDEGDDKVMKDKFDASE